MQSDDENDSARPTPAERLETGITLPARRTRIGRACDTCRKKRTRCDGRQPTCIPCANYGLKCTYLEKPVPKIAKPKPPQNETVEERLGRIEKLLADRRDGDSAWSQSPRERKRSRRERSDSESLSDDADKSPRSSSTKKRFLTEEHVASLKDEGVDDNESPKNSLGSLVVNNVGDLQYLGPSSGVAVISQADGLLTNHDAIKRHLHMSEFDSSANEVPYGDSFIQLPRKEIADMYIDAYFKNSPFPTLYRPNFQRRADQLYTLEPPREKCFIASWSMVLAFGSHYMTRPQTSERLEETEGWKYFCNAQDKLPDLLQGSNLSALQALLLIVQYLQFTGRASRWLLMGACAQLAQALGLHRASHSIVLDPSTQEERLRAFWVCYVMDKTISMTVGRSSTLQDYDLDVGLPSSSGNPFFLHSIRFAQITSKVYRRLYAAQSMRRHTPDSLADAIGELDAELLDWRASIPVEYRPEHEIGWKNDTLHQHVLQLHLSYYNCMYNIHRAVFSLPSSGPAPFASCLTPDRPLQVLRRNRVYGSAALAIGAARAGLRLILDVEERCAGLVDMRIWLLSYYPFSAIIALFMGIIHNPGQASARSDLEIISGAKKLFENICVRSDVLDKMTALTCRFEQEAEAKIGSCDQSKDSTVQQTSESRARKEMDYDGFSLPRKIAAAPPPASGILSTPHNTHAFSGEYVTDATGWIQGSSSATFMGDDVSSVQNMDFGTSSNTPPLPYQGHSQQPAGIFSGEPLDIWQAPTNFEWEDWAGFVGRFRTE